MKAELSSVRQGFSSEGATVGNEVGARLVGRAIDGVIGRNSLAILRLRKRQGVGARTGRIWHPPSMEMAMIWPQWLMKLVRDTMARNSANKSSWIVGHCEETVTVAVAVLVLLPVPAHLARNELHSREERQDDPSQGLHRVKHCQGYNGKMLLSRAS